LTSQTAQSAGDALRELDAMQVLNHDNPFLLLHGPIVSNFNLEKMVNAHKKRKEADSNYIMTVGIGKGGRYVRSWPH
jgi:translation initiation factor eIF-2B subunit epsilon